jgi:hypothetical protein
MAGLHVILFRAGHHSVGGLDDFILHTSPGCYVGPSNQVLNIYAKS